MGWIELWCLYGAVNFPPNTGAYLSLPGPNILENYTSVTIEAWVATVASQQFPRLLQFGEFITPIDVNTG